MSKIIFFHNSPAEYRIPLFQLISQKSDVKFVFTKIHLAKQIYNNDLDLKKMSKINYSSLAKGIRSIFQIFSYTCSKNTKAVVLPCLDSFDEYARALIIFIIAKITNKQIFYYWGKWEAPKNRQPLKKRIKNGFQRFVCKFIICHVDVCFVMGTKAKEYMINMGVRPDKIKLTYIASEAPVCTPKNLRTENNIPQDHNIILYFGRIIKKKGLHILIKAFNGLPEAYKQNTWLVIGGDGEYKEHCINYAEKLKAKNIVWLGYIHPDHRYAYFDQCNIFVLPTYHQGGSIEAWGMTINEAMQCGKIVIGTTAVGAAYDLITDKNGKIVRENCSKSLTLGITECLDSQLNVTAIVENKKILSKYNYDNCSDVFANVFNQVI